MTKTKESREEWVKRVVEMDAEEERKDLSLYLEKYYSINRGAVLRSLSRQFVDRGLKSYFVDSDLRGLKQHFYVNSKLAMASQLETTPSVDIFGAYQPFLYGLLSDSSEIIEWLAQAELKNQDYVEGTHFRLHQFQLILRNEDYTLRKAIEVAAKRGGKRDRIEASSGVDFFSLVLERNQEELQTYIEQAAKIKSPDEYIGQFLAGYAVILAKLCWIRGIEVKIKNPLVPMPLLPVTPLDSYDLEYEFLHAGWTPPQPSMWEAVKRWIK